MPIQQYNQQSVCCGLDINADPVKVAESAVESYREYVFYRSFPLDTPQARTMLTALYYCQECLHSIKPDGTCGYPDLEQVFISDLNVGGQFGQEEQAHLKEYLAGLKQAVWNILPIVVNKNEHVRKWWLTLQKRRFMNRRL